MWDGSVTRCGARELAPIRDITPQENIYNDYFYNDDDKEIRTQRKLYKRCWLFNERAELKIGGEAYRHRALRAFFLLGVGTTRNEPPQTLDAAEMYIFHGKTSIAQIEADLAEYKPRLMTLPLAPRKVTTSTVLVERTRRWELMPLSFNAFWAGFKHKDGNDYMKEYESTLTVTPPQSVSWRMPEFWFSGQGDKLGSKVRRRAARRWHTCRVHLPRPLDESRGLYAAAPFPCRCPGSTIRCTVSTSRLRRAMPT